MMLPLILCGAAPLEVLRRPDGGQERYAGRVVPGKVLIPRTYRDPAAEMRGAWVATVENLDIPVSPSAAGFLNSFRRVLTGLAAYRINAVFFQVRPCNDAFYASRFNPWSRYLSGQEGVPPSGGGDPLQSAIQEAHRRGMQFHAWLNPYRVTGRTKLTKLRYLSTLAPANFARKHPHLVLENRNADGSRLLFLNPGEPAVIRHVVQTVREIAEKYPVDGIVFDDYFYPYEAMGNIDAATYVRNNPRRLSRAQWRTENVTRLIREIRATLNDYQRKSGRKIPFGVSPFGIWANRKERPEGSLTAGKSSLLIQYADTRLWVKNQYVDSIIPQLYWPFGHDTAAYAALTDWWVQQVRGTRVKLYIGMAPYRIGENPQWDNPAELVNQLRYNNRYPEISGQVLYRAGSLLNPGKPALRQALKQLQNLWKKRIPAEPGPMRYPKLR